MSAPAIVDDPPVQPLRILLVIDTYPPVLGGSEIEAQRVSAALIRRGHQVRVLCAGGPPMPPVRDWTDPEGVPVSILTRHSRGLWKDRLFALEVAWAIWLGRERYDLVYFLMQGLQVALGLPLARILGMPSILKIAGSGVVAFMRRSRFGRIELDWMQKWKIPLMVLNEGMIEEAVADGFTRDQLIWTPNPVDIETFRPPLAGEREQWRETHGIPQDAAVIVYVGRLAPEKGLQGLLQGFGVAMKSVPQAMLVLVGDGPTRPHLEEMARGIDPAMRHIRFAGRAPIAEVPCWLRASDMFALTSPSEGFPCALVEAMSAGLPSVVSHIPANLQLVDDGVHGLTVQWDDAESIGRALVRLTEDPGLRSSMGREARARAVANYSTETVLSFYEKTFSRVIASARSGS